MSDQNADIPQTPEEADEQVVSPQDQEDVVPTVYLPRLIANEFGIPEGNAWEMVASGEVEISEQPWTGDKMYLPVEDVDGKTIVVRSTVRTVTFTYKHDD